MSETRNMDAAVRVRELNEERKKIVENIFKRWWKSELYDLSI